MSKRNGVVVAVFLVLIVIVIYSVLVPRRPRVTDRQEGDLKSRLEKLRSLPYTSVTPDTVDTKESGVRVHQHDAAYEGYNIYCSRISPHVYLMDMEGRHVHTWGYGQGRPWQTVHAVMLDNGDIIVLGKSKYARTVLKLAWNSNVLWEINASAHHEIALLPDSTFYVFARSARKHRDLWVEFSSIVRLSPSGGEVERWSTYDHLQEIKEAFDQRSFLDTILDSLLASGDSLGTRESIPGKVHVLANRGDARLFDYFHPNTITILPDTPLGRKDKRFSAGNLLVCFRNVNQIAILERNTKDILWAWGEGILQWPHHPTMLDDGNILVFDNGVERQYSQIVELNPETEEIAWEYVADPPESFFSFSKGSAQRLPNGNTLICDSDNGRAFEVTTAGGIVWEWLNPQTKDGHRVVVYRMERLAPEMVEPLLENP